MDKKELLHYAAVALGCEVVWIDGESYLKEEGFEALPWNPLERLMQANFLAIDLGIVTELDYKDPAVVKAIYRDPKGNASVRSVNRFDFPDADIGLARQLAIVTLAAALGKRKIGYQNN